MINPFTAIKAFFTVKSTATDIQKEASMPTASGKPGWKTTEFWVKIFTVDLPTIYLAVRGFIPAKDALIIETAAGAIYGIYRTVAKGIADVQAAKASA